MQGEKSQNDIVELAKKAGAVEVEGKVKWFDSVKGFGFMVSEDQENDILVHFSVLKEIGLTSVPEGATLKCLAIEGMKGWQAIRVSAIDLSTATPADELMNGDDDFDPTADLENISDYMEATVKWFNRLRGYGFISQDEDSDDIFIHLRVLKRGGIDEVFPGQKVMVKIGDGPRGPLVAEVKLPDDE